MLSLAAIPWFDHLLRAAGRPDLAQLNPSGAPGVLGIVSAATVGAVLASRRPRHPVGWLLLGLGLSVSASGVADGYAPYRRSRPRTSAIPARPVHGQPVLERLEHTLHPVSSYLVFRCSG